MELWRISNHISLAGEGGRRAPARWHSGGVPIVYLATSPPGALIEVFVHLEIKEWTLPPSYTLLRIAVPDSLAITPLAPPQGWKTREELTRKIGDTWLASRSSALATVPSAIMPHTLNYLLNPTHPDARQVSVVESTIAPYDSRLFKAVHLTRP